MVAESADRQKELMLLMTRHQRQILAYIFTLIPNRESAEEILQQASLVICEKFSSYSPGSDFVAWACQIAWWEVKKARLNRARSKVVFDDAMLESLSTTSIEMAPELNERRLALSKCLARLNERDRTMLMTRYEPGGSVEDAAERSGRSLPAAYKALCRLRKLLLDCVTNQLPVGETR